MPAPLTRSSWRRALAGGTVVLALSGLAACGGGGGASDTSHDSFSAGGSSGSASGSATTSDSGSSADHQPGDSVPKDEVVGLMKKAVGGLTSAHMTLNAKISAMGQSATMDGQGDVSMNPLAEDMTMSMMGQKMHIILVDGVEYLQMGSANGGKWMKMDLAQLAKQSGMGGASSALTNPLALLDKMSGAITKATYVGKDGDGDHYQVTVDSAKALSATGSGSTTPTGIPATMTEDLWFDGDGHLSKMTMDMGSTGTMSGKLSDYGESVDIKAPPASQVTDMGSLSGSTP